MKKIIACCSFLLFTAQIFAEDGIQFSHGTWKEILSQAKKENKLVFIDVYTSWCGPCKKMAPFLGEIAREQAKTLDFVPIDADSNQLLSIELRIEALPTLLLYRKGELLWRHVGYINKADLSEKISSFM